MSAQPPKGRPPGRPPAKPVQQRPQEPAQQRPKGPAQQRPQGPAQAKAQAQPLRKAPHAAPPSQGPGCLASLFLDLTGLGFLAAMRKKLGGGLFWFSFLSVLLLMFLAGAKIERWNHLGEANYVAQILPMASCFSPILAFLMTMAFAVGDVLTTATYWLFPQDSNLNLFHLFNKSHPLLTWGAYARMDFITLPLYALLPGLGSRIAYGIASRIFQAGRAKSHAGRRAAEQGRPEEPAQPGPLAAAECCAGGALRLRPVRTGRRRCGREGGRRPDGPGRRAQRRGGRAGRQRRHRKIQPAG